MTRNKKRDRQPVGTTVLIIATLAVVGIILTAILTMPPKAGPYVDSTTKALVMDGVWESDSDPKFKALIRNGVIEINIVAEDTTTLYWKGTFPWTPDATEIKSMADRAALDPSMFGSGEESKTFVYRGSQLDFDFTIMGTKTTIELEKN